MLLKGRWVLLYFTMYLSKMYCNHNSLPLTKLCIIHVLCYYRVRIEKGFKSLFLSSDVYKGCNTTCANLDSFFPKLSSRLYIRASKLKIKVSTATVKVAKGLQCTMTAGDASKNARQSKAMSLLIKSFEGSSP